MGELSTVHAVLTRILVWYSISYTHEIHARYTRWPNPRGFGEGHCQQTILRAKTRRGCYLPYIPFSLGFNVVQYILYTRDTHEIHIDTICNAQSQFDRGR